MNRPQTAAWFLAIGKNAVWFGFALAVMGFSLVQLGIPEAAFLYIGTLLFFLLKIVAMIYENNLRAQVDAVHRQVEHERLRLDLVKALIEQANQTEEDVKGDRAV